MVFAWWQMFGRAIITNPIPAPGCFTYPAYKPQTLNSSIEFVPGDPTGNPPAPGPFIVILTIPPLIFFALVAGIFCQQVADKYNIDTFNSVTAPLVIVINATSQFPIILSASTQDATIVGGERDLILKALSGPPLRLLTSSVDNNQWDVSNSNSVTGVATQQYDGIDGSPNLVKTGLNGFNFRQQNSDTIHCSISSDIDTIYTFTFYDMTGKQESQNLTVTGSSGLNDFFLPFSTYKIVDLTNIGALEVVINAFNNVDTFVDTIAVQGPAITPTPTPSNSNTPTRTTTPSPGGSGSNTPTPTRTPSPQSSAPNTPTPTNSPSPQGSFFTWYTVDDDFGRNPCDQERPKPSYFWSDDNILYYYFYGSFNATDDLLTKLDSGSSSSTLKAFMMLTTSVIVLLVF